MDLSILKKKISTFRSDGGKLRNVSDELLMEILMVWESWSGTSSGFYSGIGVDHRKMASLLGKAKKLKREGHFPAEEFKEIKLVDSSVGLGSAYPCGIEMAWENGKIIRFSQVEQLVDFLKKVS